MEIEFAIVGDANWAGPMLGVAIDKQKTCEPLVVNFGPRTIDKSNIFQLTLNLINKLQKRVIEAKWEVKEVHYKGYILAGCPWPIRKEDTSQAEAIGQKLLKAIFAEYHQRFPDWDFDKHQGQGTKEHRALIIQRKKGSPVHRRSFAPLSRFVQNKEFNRSDQGHFHRGIIN